MKNFNLLRKSERKSVGTTLALTVGSPSFDRRGTMLKHYAFMLLFLLGSLNVWGETATLISALNDIESGESYYIAAHNSDKYYTIPNTTINGQTFTCSEGNISGTTLTPATDAGEFVFTAVPEVDNAYYIYNTNLNKYLVATGSKKFGYVDNTSSDYGYWTFSTVSSGGFSGAFSVKHSSKTQYLRAFNNSIRCYDSATNQGVYLFVKSTSGGGSTQPTVSVTPENITWEGIAANAENQKKLLLLYQI